MAGDWLILHAGALGDLILTIQLALRLPGVNGSSKLHILSRSDPGDLSGCRPAVSRQSVEGLSLHRLHAESDEPLPDRLRELVTGRRVLNALAGVDSVVHRRLELLGPAALYSFDPRPKPGLNTHITAQWQRELQRQGLLFSNRIDRTCDSSTLNVPDELRRCGRQVFALLGVGGQPILIHPGSGGRSKCWRLSSFLEVARGARATNVLVCFVVGPVELERWSVMELDAIRAEFPLINAPEPNELLGLLAGARAFVSSDCGPAHLAALVGTPTVAIFGPTSPTIWRPLGPNARVVAGDSASHPGDWGLSLECVLLEVIGCVADAERSS
ncbi:MAG TPA: glycosyltransferase family 9 protein [Phycisphaerae bacterium]|nr:glycosyltransferase family 9 protein [Phycisphaerae bacterium]